MIDYLLFSRCCRGTYFFNIDYLLYRNLDRSFDINRNLSYLLLIDNSLNWNLDYLLYLLYYFNKFPIRHTYILTLFIYFQNCLDLKFNLARHLLEHIMNGKIVNNNLIVTANEIYLFFGIM